MSKYSIEVDEFDFAKEQQEKSEKMKEKLYKYILLDSKVENLKQGETVEIVISAVELIEFGNYINHLSLIALETENEGPYKVTYKIPDSSDYGAESIGIIITKRSSFQIDSIRL